MDRSRPPDVAAPSRAGEIAVALAGCGAFLGANATQPLLPTIQAAFGAGKGAAALTVSAPTIAVALASPLAGALALRLGHRRVIVAALAALAVPTLLAATAGSLPALVGWRFAQGLVVPFVYAVALAFVTEEWPAAGLGRAMSALVTGNVIGGFSGRFLSGLVAHRFGWRASFVVLAALTAGAALVASRALPRLPRRPRPAKAPGGRWRGLARLLRERPLVATCAVGFNVFFTLVATFTYVTFHLAAPPFGLGASALAAIFVVYLAGAAITPVAGRWIDRVGSRRTLTLALAAALAGGVAMLAPSLPWVVVGLTATCTSVFVSQSAATAYLPTAAPPDARGAASGLYVCCYYVGGALGGLVPAAAWRLGGWPACVALVAALQVATIAIAWRFWRPQAAPAAPVAEADGVSAAA